MSLSDTKLAIANQEANEKLKESEGVYSEAVLTFTTFCSIRDISRDLKKHLTDQCKSAYEGKCAPEGFIEPNSLNIITYSGAELKGSHVKFNVVAKCRVANPVVGMNLRCSVVNITKTAGVRAEMLVSPTPIVVYLARDHHLGRSDFNDLQVGGTINVQVLGVRFELNDKYISVIAELKDSNLVKDI